MVKKYLIKTYRSLDWQLIGIFSIFSLLLLCLYVFRISSLLPGFTAAEKSFINNASSLRTIFDNPLFAPHKILQYIMIKLDHNGFLAMRMPSILLGTIVVGMFYTVLRRWFNVFISAITTLLLATNSFFINNVRYSSPEVTILIAVLLLAYGLWLNTKPSPRIALLAGVCIAALSLYTPGLIWFFMVFLVWQKDNLIHIFHKARPLFLLSVLSIILIVTPLLISLISTPKTITTYLGIPSQLQNAVINLPKNLIIIPYNLFWHGSNSIELNLVGTPIFDIFILAMFILGFYYFIIENKKRFSALTLTGILLVLIFIALNNSRYLVLLVPLVYIGVASGINEMLNKWYAKFPNNPIAKGLAYSLVIVAVASSCFYNLNKYYIAWPQTPATKKVFHIPPNPSQKTININ